MAPCARRHKITVNDDVFIGVDGTHVSDVAQQVVMGYQPPATDQLWRRGHKPQAVTDDAFEDALLRKSALEKDTRWRRFVDILSVSEAVRHDRRRYDDGRITSQRRIIHVLEAFMALEWHLILVPVESQGRLTPQPGQEM